MCIEMHIPYFACTFAAKLPLFLILDRFSPVYCRCVWRVERTQSIPHHVLPVPRWRCPEPDALSRLSVSRSRATLARPALLVHRASTIPIIHSYDIRVPLCASFLKMAYTINTFAKTCVLYVSTCTCTYMLLSLRAYDICVCSTCTRALLRHSLGDSSTSRQLRRSAACEHRGA
jgi:hypothetical protein